VQRERTGAARAGSPPTRAADGKTNEFSAGAGPGRRLAFVSRTAPFHSNEARKNPAIAVCNSSFELIRNRWDPPGCFRRPVKACRPQPHSSDPVDHQLRFKDIVSNHVHRQGNSKILIFEFLATSQRTRVSSLTQYPPTMDRTPQFLKEIIFRMPIAFLRSPAAEPTARLSWPLSPFCASILPAGRTAPERTRFLTPVRSV